MRRVTVAATRGASRQRTRNTVSPAVAPIHIRRLSSLAARPAVRSSSSSSSSSSFTPPPALSSDRPLAQHLRSTPSGPYYPPPTAQATIPTPRYQHLPHFCTAVIPTAPQSFAPAPSTSSSSSPSSQPSRLSPAHSPYVVPSFYTLPAYPRATVGSKNAARARKQRNHIPCVVRLRSDPSFGLHFTVERANIERIVRQWQEPCAKTRIGTLLTQRVDPQKLVEDEQVGQTSSSSSSSSSTTPTTPTPDDSSLPHYAVRLHAVDRHSVTNEILHVVFNLYDTGRPLKLSIPVEYINELESVGVRKGGLLVHVKHAVDVWYRGPPKAIPSKLIVDLLHLPMGRVVTSTDLVLPSGCSLWQPWKPPLVMCTIQGLGKQVNWQEEEEGAAAAAGGAVATATGGTAAAATTAAGAKGAPAAAAKKDEAKKK